MKSISNSMLASETTTIVQKITQDSLQELNRLQAVAVALQNRPESEDENIEYDDNDQLYDEEALLDEMEDEAYGDEIADSDDELLDEMIIDDYNEDEHDTVDTQPIIIDTSYDEIEDNLEGYDTDGFEEDDVDVEETNLTDNASIPLTDTLITPPISKPLAPPMSTPLMPPGMPVVLKSPVSTHVDSEQSLAVQRTYDEDLEDYDDTDYDDGFDEQDIEFDNAEDQLDLDAQILEKMEDDEQLLENESDRGLKIANTFEKIEPESESLTKSEISFDAKSQLDVSAEIDDFLNDSDTEEELDLSVLDSVPIIESVSVQNDTQLLEEENARLRQQLAQFENEKLKQQIAEQQKIAKQPAQEIKLNLGVTIAQPTKTEKQPTQVASPIVDSKEAEQRKRWAKYATMSTPDLWKLVYKFMVMAGVQSAPVKAKVLVSEFGSHNIKRLEATYIMATKDGYTC